MQTKEVMPGDLKKIIWHAVQIAQKNKKYSYEDVMHRLINIYPILENTDKCPNCQANMYAYVYHFDCLDVILLLRMAQVINRAKMKKGVSFTQANQVRIHDLPVSYAVKSRTNQMAKLGLIAQVRDGKTRVPGTWLITKRGWQALRGAPVPAAVKSWRNKLDPDFKSEDITILEAREIHREKVERRIEEKKKIRSDYRSELSEWEPSEWYGMEKMEGKLI